jgi:hypothetical protein
MAWDSTRPVPWRRLIREWLIYAAIMAAVFIVIFQNDSMVGAVVGLLASGPLYLLFGAVLAKFGYQRKTLKQLRAERVEGAERVYTAAKSVNSTDSGDSGVRRERPAPTRRTSGGGRSNRPGNRRR